MQKWVYEEIAQLDFDFAAKGLNLPCQPTDPTPVANLVSQKTRRGNLRANSARGTWIGVLLGGR
jgi:hypothetical protein